MTVDRTKQRSWIADVTVEVIAREGIEAATIRRIAAEIGCSTSVVTHYFEGKQELLISAYGSLREELAGKFACVLARDPADLLGALLCMTAADEVSLKRWRTYVAFWDRAARDPVWAVKHHEDLELALSRIEEVIRHRNGEDAGHRETARMLNAFIQGISVQVLMTPQTWPRDKIEAAIAGLIDRLLGPPAAGWTQAPTAGPLAAALEA